MSKLPSDLNEAARMRRMAMRKAGLPARNWRIIDSPDPKDVPTKAGTNDGD